MRILIAGCGEIGTRVGLKLHTKGHQIFGLKRNINTLPGQIIPISADLSYPINQQTLPPDIDQIIYILAAGGFNEQAYQRAYVDGIAHLIAALEKNLDTLQRFIFVSSTSVYAQDTGEWVDEKSATKPVSFNGRIMLQAEQLVLALTNSLVVRFSGIYGPGRTRMLDQVKSGRLAAAEPVIYSNRVHSDDCVKVLVHLSEMERLQYKLILASDHHPVPLHEIHRWLANELGVLEKNRQYQIPNRRAGSKRISNKRLLEIGYKFIYPNCISGYKRLLD